MASYFTENIASENIFFSTESVFAPGIQVSIDIRKHPDVRSQQTNTTWLYSVSHPSQERLVIVKTMILPFQSTLSAFWPQQCTNVALEETTILSSIIVRRYIINKWIYNKIGW